MEKAEHLRGAGVRGARVTAPDGLRRARRSILGGTRARAFTASSPWRQRRRMLRVLLARSRAPPRPNPPLIPHSYLLATGAVSKKNHWHIVKHIGRYMCMKLSKEHNLRGAMAWITRFNADPTIRNKSTTNDVIWSRFLMPRQFLNRERNSIQRYSLTKYIFKLQMDRIILV